MPRPPEHGTTGVGLVLALSGFPEHRTYGSVCIENA